MASTLILGRERNRITFDGAFGIQDVRKVYAILHESINGRGYSEIVLDFTRCANAQANAMVPLCTHILALREARIDFQLILPQEDRVRRLFLNAGWANFVCPRDNPAPRRNTLNRQYPAVQYKTHEEQEEVLNDVLEKLLAVIPNLNRSAFAAVEWALNEISDNVLNHSQSPVGGILQICLFDRTTSKVEFTIADAGVGVPATLRNARPEIVSDADALMEAVKSGVTRDARDFQGNGLYGTLEICRVSNGRFSLNGGNGVLLRSVDGVVTARNESVPFNGTSVDAVIDFSEPALLERALAIEGRIHRPVDYIELNYEQDELGSIPFSLTEHSFSYRSRPAGRPVFTKLGNIITACPGQTIVVDFKGISVISSSFADEVFGKLFVSLGPMKFMQAIRLVNVNPTIQALIDRAITQRMQNPTKEVL
jgi:anti-sigma regulatory factor (Ser/Thr protein kinase)